MSTEVTVDNPDEKLLVENGSGRIPGSHIVGPDAAVLIHEVIVAMNADDGTAARIRESIHVHTSLSDLNGTLFVYGALSGEPTPFALTKGLNNALTMRGYTLFEVIGNPDRFQRGKRFIADGLESGDFSATVSKTFGFDEMVAAYRYMESNQQFGKIVVTT